MSKKLAQEYIKKGDKINTIVVFDDGKSFKIEVEGEFKTMSDSGFSKKQLEQLGQLMDFKLTPIVQRLDNIEKDVNILKSFHKNDLDKLKSQNKK